MGRRKYKRIYCCGDCVQYNYKKHRCRLGANEEGGPLDHFYLDCPLTTYEEEEKEGERNEIDN